MIKLLSKHYGSNWNDLPNLEFYKKAVLNGLTTEQEDCDEDIPMVDFDLRI